MDGEGGVMLYTVEMIVNGEDALVSQCFPTMARALEGHSRMTGEVAGAGCGGEVMVYDETGHMMVKTVVQ